MSKSSRDILWLGAKNEEPPKALGKQLGRIQFIAFSKFKPEQLQKAKVLIVSAQGSGIGDLAALEQATLDMSALNKLHKIILFNKFDAEVCLPIRNLINRIHFDQIFILPEDESQLVHSLTAEKVAQPVEPTQVRMDAVSVKSLEDEFLDLEQLVQQGTEHVASAKREIEIKVTKMRKLIRFLEELASLHSISDLMKLVRNELKEFHHLKDPVLVIAAPNKPAESYYFQGAQVFKRQSIDPWPVIMQARFNDTRDSQYLANMFSRPFARLFSVPIQIRKNKTSDEVSSGVLYFEHSLSENEKHDFLEYIDERLNLIGVALDRLFLENDLREASFIWERTFDEIADPVAIFDDDKKLVRSNKAFQTRFADMENPNFSKDNIHYKGRSFEVRRYPILGGDGTYSTNVVIHYLDVTLSHQLQKQMIQQEKMAALGHLAGNIAHELNNPLTGIQSMAQILSVKSDVPEQIQEDLQEIDSAAERCQKIIKNLLDFSKGESEQQHLKTNLNHIVQNTLPLLKTLVSMHRLELDLQKDLPEVEIEPQLFQQVVFNLIKNACQAMDDGGQLIINTKSDQGQVYLTVKDNGPGMPEEIQSQIFEYFFTTKPKGEGTGLGLSMSRSIVQRFGGSIDVISSPGEGTEFKIVLPIAGLKK